MKTLRHLALMAASFSMILMSGCVGSGGAGQVAIDDNSITTAIRHRFVQHQQVDAASIGVETHQGAVTISGMARNFTEKTAAERLTWKVNGVTSVKNDITVKP